MLSLFLRFGTIFLALTIPLRAELPDISTVPVDLTIPAVQAGDPAAGRRVPQSAGAWQGTPVHHLLYLPENWHPGGSWPVLVEYAGNGGFQNQFGDRCEGTVEGCRLGYGLSAGRDYLWLCLPFVQTTPSPQNAALWWGDPDETVRYCLAAVRETCARYGGDPRRVVFLGFSRGAIAGNFIGLRTEEIASLWCGLLLHSHYDGVRSRPYAGSDRASSLARLQRLGQRPQFISHEGGAAETRAYLESTGIAGRFTFADFLFRNHTDAWALRECELRRQARAWLQTVTRLPSL